MPKASIARWKGGKRNLKIDSASEKPARRRKLSISKEFKWKNPSISSFAAEAVAVPSRAKCQFYVESTVFGVRHGNRSRICAHKPARWARVSRAWQSKIRKLSKSRRLLPHISPLLRVSASQLRHGSGRFACDHRGGERFIYLSGAGSDGGHDKATEGKSAYVISQLVDGIFPRLFSRF